MGILEVSIVGLLLSLFIQWIKDKLGTDSLGTKLITVGLALVVGGLIYFFQNTAYWETAIGVLAAASTVYAFFLKK